MVGLFVNIKRKHNIEAQIVMTITLIIIGSAATLSYSWTFDIDF